MKAEADENSSVVSIMKLIPEMLETVRKKEKMIITCTVDYSPPPLLDNVFKYPFFHGH